MNEEYNKVNVKLLSILAYIGPLFLMGKLSVEKDEPHVKFHTHQGAILFCFVAGAYVVGMTSAPSKRIRYTLSA